MIYQMSDVTIAGCLQGRAGPADAEAWGPQQGGHFGRLVRDDACGFLAAAKRIQARYPQFLERYPQKYPLIPPDAGELQ